MRDQPRRRRRVSPVLLRLLRPFIRFSSARDAYVLRIGGGQRGPVLVDKTAAPGATPVVLSGPQLVPTGRFQRADGSEVAGAAAEPQPATKSRQG